MLRKIKSALKMQSSILLSVTAVALLSFLMELYTYRTDRNLSFNEMMSIETNEFFMFIFFSVLIGIILKTYFKFFTAIGVSRKGVFITNILTFFITSPFIALGNIAILKAFYKYPKFESIFIHKAF